MSVPETPQERLTKAEQAWGLAMLLGCALGKSDQGPRRYLNKRVFARDARYIVRTGPNMALDLAWVELREA